MVNDKLQSITSNANDLYNSNNDMLKNTGTFQQQ